MAKQTDARDQPVAGTEDTKTVLKQPFPHPQLSTRPRLRVKQQLTIPLISMAHRDILTCQVLAEPKQADFEVGNTSNPPMLVLILDLDTMTKALLVCNVLILSSFQRMNGSIVGRYFQLKQGALKKSRNNQDYREIDIAEMEIDNA